MAKRCHHCRRRKVRHTWTLRPCAIGRPTKIRLCSPCDLQLNSYVVRFMRHPMAAALITAYRGRA